MLFRLVSYLNFLRYSTNQHDVHSPFVYNFVIKCLYSKPRESKKKLLDVALKTIKYFNFKSILIEKNESLKNELIKHYPKLSLGDRRSDLIYLQGPSLNDLSFMLFNKQIHNDTMLIVDDIHKNKENKRAWNTIIKLPEITVSINLFHCGVLFFRKEQMKEHFTIRI
ncbi:hypothetical protein [Croceitalea rosinachiae]|uniref:Uncharacterized protein n=1 Tax=Croceitalea rosinachiae TaxID=3075596 RepID=A0ABU3A9U6_9FLAO|nr:hypothetical protein [Croceitalea sp. F388]MDT0606949.1 hypothetical protein [Croceitalea sp. F388]